MNINNIGTWHVCDPNLKGEIPDTGGKAIADPMVVIRGIIFTDGLDNETLTLYTPPISGRLERVVVIPDHNAQPDDNFDMTLVQHYVESPPIYAGDTPYQDTLDLLNGLGTNIPNDAITHFTVYDEPPYPADVRTGILPQLLVQDRLVLNITHWDTEEDDARAYIYLYFSAAGFSAGVSSASGPAELELWGPLKVPPDVEIENVANSLTFGAITTPDLNSMGTVSAIYLIIKFDSRRNSGVAANELFAGAGFQVVTIEKDALPVPITGLSLPNGMWYTNEVAIGGGMGNGDKIVGNIDIKGQVELAGGTSTVSLPAGQALQSLLVLQGVQVGLKVIFT